DHLQVEPRRRAALVQLAGRVLEARAETVRHDAPGRLARLRREREHLLLVRRSGIHERLNADVVALPRLRVQLFRRALRRDVRLLAGGQDLPRLVLARLHVRLVERVDAEDRAGDRDRELPAEELLAELVLAGEPHVLRLPVRAVRRFAGGRNEPLALLACRLGDQLLGPQTEAGLALREAHLVASVLPVLAHRQAELEARVAL